MVSFALFYGRNNISNIIFLLLVWDKRRRRAEMAPQIDAMLVSPDTMTKRGGQHVFSFLICAFVSEL